MSERPITHGVRRDARRLGIVRPSHGVKERLSDRSRRAQARLQRRLDTEPFEAIRDGLIGSISRGRLLCEQADAALLASTDLRSETGLAKFSGWLHNRVRRDSEMLLLIEEKGTRDKTPSLSEYLAARSAGNGTPAPATAAVGAETPVQGSEEPTP